MQLRTWVLLTCLFLTSGTAFAKTNCSQQTATLDWHVKCSVEPAFAKADQALQVSYKKLLSHFETSPHYVHERPMILRNLQDSQRAWMSAIEKNCEFMSLFQGMSIHRTIAKTQCMTNKIQERTVFLNSFLS